MKSGKRQRSVAEKDDPVDAKGPDAPDLTPVLEIIDGREAERLLLEVVLGRPESETTEAGARYRRRLRIEVRELAERGVVIDIPGEFPD